MTETPAELLCHRCGYDLRAQSNDGKCPECGEPVTESRRVAAIPRHPLWRDTDPRWRRRIVAAVWVLTLLPAMDLLVAFDGAANVPVPPLINYRNGLHTLDETFLYTQGVYQALIFCTGVVLLFAREQGRRRSRLDWTRRWGILCSYVVFILAAVPVLFISALVLAGIAALFQSMALRYQPGVTRLCVELSTRYLRYGPHPRTNAPIIVLAVLSSITILLACIPLYRALASSGPRRLAPILLAPIASFALLHLVQLARYCLGSSTVDLGDVYRYHLYFFPKLPAYRIAGHAIWPSESGSDGEFAMEIAKWCILLAIAILLTAAQLNAWRRRPRPTTTQLLTPQWSPDPRSTSRPASTPASPRRWG